MKVLFYTEPFDSTAINNMLLDILFQIKSDIEKKFTFTEEELKTTGIVVIVFKREYQFLEHFAFPEELKGKIEAFIDSFDMNPAIERIKNIRAN